MWKYLKKYLPVAVLCCLFMLGEVWMGLLQPKIMSSIVDNGILGIDNNGTGDLHIIWISGIKMAIIAIVGGFCGAANSTASNFFSQSVGNAIRKDSFRHIMAFAFQQIDEFSTGSLITRVTNDITQTQEMLAQYVRGLVRTCALTLGSLYYIFQMNLYFGLCALCVVPFIYGCLICCLKKSSPLFLRLQSELDQVNTLLHEDISGIRMIKASVRELYEEKRFGKANGKLIHTQLRVLVLFAFMHPFVLMLTNMAIVCIIFSGSLQVQTGGASPGMIMAAVTYMGSLLNGIVMIIMMFQSISRGRMSWKRIQEILNCEPELSEGELSEGIAPHGSIEFKNVGFSYPNSKHRVLNNVSFSVKSGETVGIIGATGCGKSTLVNLIARFYDADEGEILVDGVNVRNYSIKALRKKMSIVLQKSELFSKSISDNLRWGDDSASQDSVTQAAMIAQADGFIAGTTNGYDTVIAERGANLSGGQKQRLSIARALLKNAEILILDNATSALDLKTEAAFYDALEEARSDVTKIIVSQRLSSVKFADHIIVLDKGTIVGYGTHDELMQSSKIYQDIFYSQLGEGAGG